MLIRGAGGRGVPVRGYSGGVDRQRGAAVPAGELAMFVVSVDLGQSADYTAVAVLERTGDGDERRYSVRWLERWLAVPYPEQVQRVGAILQAPALRQACLVLDRTGCGRPVHDMFLEAGHRPVGVTLH